MKKIWIRWMDGWMDKKNEKKQMDGWMDRNI